ncbi:MAG: Peptide methionine sulfoxide reductase MsrA [bacterium ADurb.Bin429]|nr:MAG: Peptide methionine sulfoxide reductase MsrA [bacterium ADurb.Bin429]
MRSAGGYWLLFWLIIIVVGFLAWRVFGQGSMAVMPPEGAVMEKAIFGAGCFWGVEEAFRTLPGVVKTRAGYTGGTTEHPTYEQVCAGVTGHTEAVEVTYDPAHVTYDELLRVFWKAHDPTRHKKAQYKSVIFYSTREQQNTAEASKATLETSGKYQWTVETEILPAAPFWPAEEYHQQYYKKHGGGSCPI